MSIHKITPFLSDIKTFFKNSDMTAAMQNISSVLTQVKMTERDTLAVASKRIHLRSDHKAEDTCLIIDDTDHEKTGRTIDLL